MGFILFCLFVGIPLIEIMLFIQIGGAIGMSMTVVIVILTALVGSFLLRWQGLATLQQARGALERSELPLDSVIHGIFLVIAGAFLLTPGFLTDTIGFLLFVPPFRLAAGRWLMARMKAGGGVRMETHSWNSRGPGQRPGRGPGNTIDGEVIDGDAEEIDDER